MMDNHITKHSKRNEVKKLLNAFGVFPSPGWDIIMWMLLNDCDYIRLEGYGDNCILVQCRKDER